MLAGVVPLLAFVCLASPGSMTASDRSTSALEDLEAEVKKLVDSKRRSVVRVVARDQLEGLLGRLGSEVEIEALDARDAVAQRVGSGVVLDNEGHIATLSSVVWGSSDVSVIPADGVQCRATVKGIDEDSGLAVLVAQDARTLEPVRFGDSAGLTVGSVVTAMASAQGDRPDFSLGLVAGSGIRREQNRRGSYLRLSAHSFPGAGGAPVFDSKGDFVGLVFGAKDSTAGARGAIAREGKDGVDEDFDDGLQFLRALHAAGTLGGGVSYALPGNVVQRISDQIIHSGAVQRGWLGITVEEEGPGVVSLTEVKPGSPADRAGLLSGDRIVSIDGRPLQMTAIQIDEISALPPGTPLSVSVERGGRELTLLLQLGRSPRMSRIPSLGYLRAPHPPLGVIVDYPDDEARVRLGAPPGQGMIVVQVHERSRAESAGLRRGDLILATQGGPTRNIRDLRQALARQGHDEILVMTVLRSGRRLTVEVPPPSFPPPAPGPPRAPEAPRAPHNH